MEEGVIVSWQVKVGDEVAPGDILAEVETDKATMDLENYEKGTILHLNAEEGKAVPVDGIIAVVGKKGESFEDLLTEEPAQEENVEESAATNGQPAQEEAVKSVTPSPVIQPESTTTDDRVKASPLAKKMASEKGIALTQVSRIRRGRTNRETRYRKLCADWIAPCCYTVSRRRILSGHPGISNAQNHCSPFEREQVYRAALLSEYGNSDGSRDGSTKVHQ